MTMRTAFAALLVAVGLLVAAVAPSAQSSDEVLLKQAVDLEKAKGDVKGAIEIYKRLVASANPKIAAIAREELNRLLVPVRSDASVRPTERTIWSGADVPQQLTLSYDGRLAANLEGGNLAIRDLATGTDRSVVGRERAGATRGFAAWAAFSRDGRFIAYDWRVQPDTGAPYDELRVVPADAPIGTPIQPRTLLVDRDTGGFSIRPTDWSPDGTQVAVTIGHPADRTRQLGVVDVKTGAFRMLKTAEFRGSSRLVFSPDGRYLAFDLPASASTAQRDIHVIDVQTGRDRPLISTPDRDELVGWSKDGYLVFISDRQGFSALWAQAIVAGQPRGAAILLRAEVGTPVLFSDAGTFFHIFRTSYPRIHTAALDVSAGRLTSPATAIRTPLPMNALPSWSPDGKALAYLSSSPTDSSTVLSIQDLESGRVRENLLPVFQIVDNLRWSPDGRSIVTSGVDLDSRRALFLIDVETLQTRVAARPPDGMRFVYPQWSADGSNLLYLAATGDLTSLVSLEIATGTTRELLSRKQPPVTFGAVSPDGRWIALVNGDASVVSIASVASGEAGSEREIFRALPRSFLGGPAAEWTPDGQALLVRREQGGNAWSLWLIPVEGGSPRQVDLGVQNLSGFVRMSSQGNVVFTAGVDRRELRVVQGLQLPVRTN